LAEDYTVRGVFDVGHADFNALFIVTSLENAQDLYNLDNGVHGLLVKLTDPYLAEPVRRDLRQRLGGEDDAITWQREYSEIFEALVTEKNMIQFLLFFIVLVAAFGITSALITFVVQKTHDIGMLKAVGATDGQVLLLFLSQSMFVGFVGVILGLGLG